MPWKEKTVMDSREEFVEAVKANKKSFSALCRDYGISRKTGYKWINRASLGQQLCDQSRCPHRQPFKTAPEVEQQILALRESNPVWGSKTIKAVLESSGVVGVPSSRTCDNILKRNGCIDPLISLQHHPYQRFERDHCNELWQTDFKGDFLLRDGTRCFPLDILDDHSRFALRVEPKRAASGVKESFIRTFCEFGLPDAILSDNGAQFSGFRGGYTRFERFLMDLDVLPIHGRIKHPQTQGKIERFHRTMKCEALREPIADMKEANKVLQAWRWRYNELRPHSALGMKTPASVYTPSPRNFFTPKPYVYDEAAVLRRVNNWGYLRFGPICVFLSETMADTLLEIREGENDTFLVFYRNFQIAAIDAHTQKLVNRVIRKL